MIAKLKLQNERLQQLLKPKLKLLVTRWQLLQTREQQLLIAMAVFIVASVVFYSVTGLMKYNNRLSRDVENLNQFTLFSKQAANWYKVLNKVQANTFNQVNLTQAKADVAQILQVKDPDILIQDDQMTINVPNVQYNQVVTLLEQFRRSDALFPTQVNIIRQSKAGYVSFNAIFWVKQ